MGRKSIKEIRRREIVTAFYQVAKKEGLENASIAKVAKKMEINPSLVMHYFNTKEDLIYELIDFILERYRHIYKPKKSVSDPKERLIQIIDNLFSRKWNTLFDDGVFFSCFALVFRSKRIKAHYKDLHDSLRAMLAKALQEAKDEGAIDVADVKAASDMIFILVEGAYYYLSLSDENNDDKLAIYKNEVFMRLGLTYNVQAAEV
ncbi:TetR family transcriptional regulator C-terminal domain-containing protein [Fulvivirgaceae bacterium BMA12]|uniref:Biofilm operon icaADBC HTH-type negative transcriptional regulator IcaR n=1 Tax=Agaribacillus aureus TaxID=3051825 RepID=A0ABT8LAK5_9BACT|nr:TetR family transcriptional regulator C-terminal domain-containing protein [Fulvivirgaceae bacterium BMA12]